MKVVQQEILIDAGNFSKTKECQILLQEISNAIARVVWPPQTGKFTINPKRKGNGVKPIKEAFQEYLKMNDWMLEYRLDVGVTKRPGPIDAVKALSNGKYFAVEWETGNISSSHRAINKMVVGILENVLLAGALVLPTRPLYEYLTDRVGNFQELSPYFGVWRAVRCETGFLTVIAVEHDETSENVPTISKGTDGRALV